MSAHVTGFEQVPIERVRRFWDRRPCNLRHSPQPVGTRGYFRQVRDRKYFVESHIPRFAQFDRWRGKRVLEIGCGIGTDTVSFAAHGARVTAVDLSEKSLDLARTHTQVFGLEDRVRFYHANAEHLADVVPPEPYDLVYSFGVIHHTPHPGGVLEQVRRYLRPGGTFKMMVYHRHAWKVGWVLLTSGRGRFWKLDELIARHSEAQTGCPVTYAYTCRSVRRLLETHRFEPTRVQVEHIFPYRVSDYVRYRYVKPPYFRWMPQAVFRGLERRMGWHLCVTARA